MPKNKLQFSLEGLRLGVGGWAVGGLVKLGELVSLFRAANGLGRVYQVATSETNAENQQTNPTPKETIAAVNHWRCDGFPLYC